MATGLNKCCRALEDDGMMDDGSIEQKKQVLFHSSPALLSHSAF